MRSWAGSICGISKPLFELFFTTKPVSGDEMRGSWRANDGSCRRFPRRDHSQPANNACRAEDRASCPRAGFGLGLVLALACCLSPNKAGAEATLRSDNLDELSFDELMQTKVSTVYAASKREQSVSEAPSSVTIITSEDIKQYGYRTLADVLRSVRGFYISYDRVYNFIGVRGINRPGDFGGRVLITVDGHRLNEPIFDQAFNGGEFPLDVDLIDRVEIVRGPGSALYGNNAFFAVINIITRRGRDVDGVEASGSAASYDTYSGRLSYGQQLTNGLEFLLSGTLLDSQGHDHLFFPEFRAVNQGVVDGLDSEYRKQAFASIHFKDFTLEGAWSDRKKEMPAAPYLGAAFNRAPFDFIDERSYVELKYRHEFSCEWLVQARVFLDRYRFDGAYTFETTHPAPRDIVVNQDLALAQGWGGEVQVSKTFFNRHRVSFGAEFRDDLEVHQKNEDIAPALVYGDVRAMGTTSAFTCKMSSRSAPT